MTTQAAEISKKLPCRGCTSDCKNYDFCDGQLWRQQAAKVEQNKVVDAKQR